MCHLLLQWAIRHRLVTAAQWNHLLLQWTHRQLVEYLHLSLIQHNTQQCCITSITYASTEDKITPTFCSLQYLHNICWYQASFADLSSTTAVSDSSSASDSSTVEPSTTSVDTSTAGTTQHSYYAHIFKTSYACAYLYNCLTLCTQQCGTPRPRLRPNIEVHRLLLYMLWLCSTIYWSAHIYMCHHIPTFILSHKRDFNALTRACLTVQAANTGTVDSAHYVLCECYILRTSFISF